MTLGQTPPSADLYRSTRALCEPKLGATSIYRLLAEQGHVLFADESFAKGRAQARSHDASQARRPTRQNARPAARRAHDFALLAAAVNLARLASYGVRRATTASS